MDFAGENLLPGKLGHFFLILSLVSSLGATISYFISVQSSKGLSHARWGDLKVVPADLQWKRLARIFFIIEVISVFAVFGILFYIISNHLFEYKYAWQHSSRSLEPKYLLSCFWEGQEGSFLLWSVWHCVLGLFVIWKEKEWEAPVMAVVSFAQFALATMILGASVGDLNIGSNPFILLRNSGVLDEAPQFFNESGVLRRDYLSLIQDGNDLNPLLQNYWMVIHPPVLFLGFASTIIPFAFAIGGLWTRKYGDWVRRALPWALFSAGVFGLGIMMGAAWAYESLNFGGYWAWDPVENASLVPWLVLIGGIHTMLIYRHTGNALRTSHLFLILSFLLVLYSTYLTRSGDLQDTSVHAFTDLGMNWQLRIFLFIFVIPALVLFFIRYKRIPFIPKEEESSAREFWMFIGSLVFFLSALLIIIMTSIPVINKIAGLFTTDDKLFNPLAIGEDTAFTYNRIQIFVAIIIGILSGFGMYLKYKATPRVFLKKLLWPTLAGIGVATVVLVLAQIDYREYGYFYMAAIYAAIVAATYSLVTNASYIFSGLKGSLRRSGGAIAHVGFALMLLGILISSAKKEVLSHNTSGIFLNFGPQSTEKPGENLTLVKGVKNKMGNFWVTYEKDSSHPEKPLWFYHIRFESMDGKENFTLTPNAFVNYKGNMGLMANPDARHYITHDIFTYITSLPDPEKNKDTANFRAVPATVGDTVFYSNGFVIVEDVSSYKNIPGTSFGPEDSASVAKLRVQSKTGSVSTIQASMITKSGQGFPLPDTLVAESLVVQMQKVDGDRIELGIKESDAVMQYVTLKAYRFPGILLLWIGTIITVIGFIVSMFWRIESRKAARARTSLQQVPEQEAVTNPEERQL
ncbi:MAG TPA: cytochrome c biogenesis protein CcsA [Flavisolibacter sp.]